MKSFFVRDLVPNQVMTSTFLVHTKDIRQKKSGDPYLSLLLGDRTGEVDAKMWDNVAEVIDTFERDDFVKVKGLLQIFQNRPQLTIHKMMRLDDSGVELGDYFPCSERSPDEMFAELRAIIAGIQNPHLRSLLDAFMDDEKIARMYRMAPAAKSVHHAFLGGLMEHVLSLCQLCRVTAAHYRHIDLDLLLTGAILHDVGKITELSYERTFSYSSDGQLLGHIFIGLRMLNEKLTGFPDFPPKLRTLVEHMILSHHGQMEYGSPKLPQFPEALLLHFLDDMDSKMECMRAMIDNDRQVEGCYTGYNAAMTRAALKKDRYLNGTPEPQRTRPESAAVARPLEPPTETGTNGTEFSPAMPGVPEPPPVAKPEVAAQHPLFSPKSDSPFADKLKQALTAGSKQEK